MSGGVGWGIFPIRGDNAAQRCDMEGRGGRGGGGEEEEEEEVVVVKKKKKLLSLQEPWQDKELSW
eukprot:324913-Hanusia_phi.AAC.2